MQITAIDTVRLDEYPNIVWVEVRTDEGLVGLGETFLGTHAVASYIHETVAPKMLGGDPTAIDRWARELRGYLGGQGPGAETRGNSAIDVALWDLLGQATGQPLHVLTGGRTRHDIPIYNTCAGPFYIREKPEQSVANWGVGAGDGRDRYDDLAAFLERPGELAVDLLSEGITAMKIWPFDPYAELRLGTHITEPELERAVDPIRRIREATGGEMSVMVEFHGLWSVPAAKRIARALEPYEPGWLEDIVPADNPRALAEVARSTRCSLAGGETIAGRYRFREMLEQASLDVAIIDLSWTGGISEARKIAAMAESFDVPIALHDCTGPVVLTAATHLSCSVPNAIMQETVRAHYRGWYQDLVTELPPIAHGSIRPLDRPGLGTHLQPGLRERADAIVRSSRLDGGEVVHVERAGSAVSA
jgi:L-alanine-DL-glutamate epimerase-like enolase superfamily enzyme